MTGEGREEKREERKRGRGEKRRVRTTRTETEFRCIYLNEVLLFFCFSF